MDVITSPISSWIALTQADSRRVVSGAKVAVLVPSVRPRSPSVLGKPLYG